MDSKLKRHYVPEITALIFGRKKISMLTVNVTNQCNHNCIYCEIGQMHYKPSPNAISYSDLIWIIDEMSVCKIPKISLCGGEPSMFDGIIDIVAYAGEKNIRCSITTNGMTAYKLNERELNILKECKAEINISIDSFTDEINMLTRGTGAALSNALLSFQKLSEKHIPVTILTVISKYNYHEIYKFFTLAYEKGIKQVLFQPVIYFSNYPDRHSLENKSQLNVSVDKLNILMEQLNKILKFERTHKINSNVYRIYPWIEHYLKTAETQNGDCFFYQILKKFYCRDAFAIIDISYDGGIQPCSLTKANISIHQNRNRGLMALWTEATIKIKDDIIHERFYNYCNSCCNHFSRNMLASIMKYPIKNRHALFNMSLLLFSRIFSRMLRKIYIKI